MSGRIVEEHLDCRLKCWITRDASERRLLCLRHVPNEAKLLAGRIEEKLSFELIRDDHAGRQGRK